MDLDLNVWWDPLTYVSNKLEAHPTLALYFLNSPESHIPHYFMGHPSSSNPTQFVFDNVFNIMCIVFIDWLAHTVTKMSLAPHPSL